MENTSAEAAGESDRSQLPVTPAGPSDPGVQLDKLEGGLAGLGARLGAWEERRAASPSGERDVLDMDFAGPLDEDIAVLREKFRQAGEYAAYTDQAVRHLRGHVEMAVDQPAGADYARMMGDVRQAAENLMREAVPSTDLIRGDMLSVRSTLEPDLGLVMDGLRRVAADLAESVNRGRDERGSDAMQVLVTWAWLDCIIGNLWLQDQLAKEVRFRLAKAIERANQAGRVPNRSADRPAEVARFKKVGPGWHVRFGTEEGAFGDSKGMGYIARLLATPHRHTGALSLQLPAHGLKDAPEGLADDNHGRAKTLDARAFREFRGEIDRLTAEKEEAEACHDREEAERIQGELDTISKELKKHKMKARRLGSMSHAERAADATRKAINLALDKIQDSMPRLCRHLSKCLDRALVDFSYRPPDPGPVWDL